MAEKTYNPFLTNRALSYFPDTIQFANMMNKNSHIDHLLQYSFLLNIIRKRKRFSKWFKKNDDDVLEMVIEYYGYSVNKAKEALKILTDDQLEKILWEILDMHRHNLVNYPEEKPTIEGAFSEIAEYYQR